MNSGLLFDINLLTQMNTKFLSWDHDQCRCQNLICVFADAPSPAKLSYTSSLSSHVVKGGSVTLVCTVDSPGRPDNVTYVWSRGAHLMSDVKSSTFVISPVRLETRSNFTCAPVNEGGKGVPATVVIDVKAPPSFIQKLQTYQGVLYNSEYINLTCTVECYPLCSIIWRENGVKIDPENNPRYDIENTILPPNINKNDFESVNSTLVWNVSAWPRKQLDKTAPHSNYTCESTHNEVGTGVSSSIEIAVDCK
ncbi:hypothetical protein NQ318_019354 [Aromia moschata]|uniref:Ig-like domain-containing protein n=1 Tax=Aromia moschata TaxID=1265417 RepID=A0AAV8YC01_9CUCU|nr:hypothetical protein NQ318_019354 [Aromia moschata]